MPIFSHGMRFVGRRRRNIVAVGCRAAGSTARRSSRRWWRCRCVGAPLARSSRLSYCFAAIATCFCFSPRLPSPRRRGFAFCLVVVIRASGDVSVPIIVPVTLCAFSPEGHNRLNCKGKIWSEWQDLNLRPPRPVRCRLRSGPAAAGRRPCRRGYSVRGPASRRQTRQLRSGRTCSVIAVRISIERRYRFGCGHHGGRGRRLFG
jgi:hypothetical protein